MTCCVWISFHAASKMHLFGIGSAFLDSSSAPITDQHHNVAQNAASPLFNQCRWSWTAPRIVRAARWESWLNGRNSFSVASKSLSRVPVYCLSWKKSFQRPFTSASPSVALDGMHDTHMIGMPGVMFETSSTRRLSSRTLDMLDLINHNELYIALSQIQCEFHEQDFLSVISQIRLATG